MRIVFAILSLGSLVACAGQPVPDSGAGVGFNDYSSYQTDRMRRDEDLAGAISSSAISNETISSGATRPTAASGPVELNNPGISDEQDFSAVSSRETIESDRQRIEANRQAYTVVQPTELPKRTGSSGPSVVEYALSTQNRVGEPVYSRSTIMGQSRFNKNCSKYASSDQAQEAFLKSGGPKKDSMGLDPDGDGFACYWDPTPFRRAVSN